MKIIINVILIIVILFVMNTPFLIFGEIKFVNISSANSYYVNNTDVVILHPKIKNKVITGKLYYERLFPPHNKLYYDRLLPSGKEKRIFSVFQKLEIMFSSLTIFDIIDNVSISTSLENEGLIHKQL